MNAPWVTDDHGDSAATATLLGANSVGTGLIGTPTDADWFARASLGGATSVVVAPESVGANLDVRLDIYDSAGTQVVAVNPAVPVVPTASGATTGLDASYSGRLPAGAFFVRVTGTGQGDPLVDGYTGYGSLGRDTISESTSTLPPVTVTSSVLPAAMGYRPYSATLAASGGSGRALRWSVARGGLPPSMSLSSAGVLSSG